MALTTDFQRIGTSTYTVYGNNELRLYAKYNSQSIANNSSNVTLQLRTQALSGSYYSSGNSSSLNCNGDRGTQYYDIGTVNTSSEKTIGTWTFDLGHNANGTLTGVGASASANVFGSLNPSVGGSFDLPTIPRQANITSAPNFNDEQNPTINYSNPAGNSVSSLQARIESTSGTVFAAYRDINKTASSYTFELTNTERNALRQATPNSNTLTVKFVLKTVLGGNTFTSTSNKTMTIVNGNPTFSNFTFADVNSRTVTLTGNNQYNINGYSNIQATISSTDKATAKKSATMSKYRFIVGEQSVDIDYSDSANVSETINNATSGTYNVYAIDTRNNSTLVTKLATREIAYTTVFIDKQNSSISRNDNQAGDNAILTLNGTFWNNNFGAVTNTIKSITYRFKKSESSTWITGTTTITPTINGNNFTFTGEIASDNQDTTWDLESSYNIEVTVTDELSTSVISFILNSAIPTMSFDKEGVGILCAYDKTLGGLLQVGGKVINREEYSTDEIETNKYWIDGKKIYRKVYHVTSVSTGSNYFGDTTGIEEYINAYGILHRSNGNHYFLASYQTTNAFAAIGMDNSAYHKFNLVIGTGLSSITDAYCIIEYTKTTD